MPAYCTHCGAPVDWVNGATAAQLLGVTEGRVRQLLVAGRFPNAVKYKPPGREAAFWKIPLTDVAAYSLARRTA